MASDDRGDKGTTTVGVYGSRLADAFRLPDPPAHVSRTVRRSLLAVTELRSNVPIPELTDPLGYDDAFLVGVQLQDVPRHELWTNGRPLKVEPFKAGDTCIYDLKQDPRAVVGQAASSLHFYMPRTALNMFAEQHDLPAVADLAYTPGIGNDDPIMRHLAQAVLGALEGKQGEPGLFLDHVLSAACVHTLERYGSARTVIRRAKGGLAPWQEKRAKEMMEAALIADVSLDALAQECKFSIGHFARAFRQSTGLSPHQWLLSRRIEKAKALLLRADVTLAEVGLACGFSGQSHFTKTFTSTVGLSPGKWRRSKVEGPSFAAGED